MNVHFNAHLTIDEEWREGPSSYIAHNPQKATFVHCHPQFGASLSQRILCIGQAKEIMERTSPQSRCHIARIIQTEIQESKIMLDQLAHQIGSSFQNTIYQPIAPESTMHSFRAEAPRQIPFIPQRSFIYSDTPPMLVPPPEERPISSASNQHVARQIVLTTPIAVRPAPVGFPLPERFRMKLKFSERKFYIDKTNSLMTVTVPIFKNSIEWRSAEALINQLEADQKRYILFIKKILTNQPFSIVSSKKICCEDSSQGRFIIFKIIYDLETKIIRREGNEVEIMLGHPAIMLSHREMSKKLSPSITMIDKINESIRIIKNDDQFTNFEKENLEAYELYCALNVYISLNKKEEIRRTMIESTKKRELTQNTKETDSEETETDEETEIKPSRKKQRIIESIPIKQEIFLIPVKEENTSPSVIDLT